MGFAQFILKIEADTKGVNLGVDKAINNFKRLGETTTRLSRAAKEEQIKAAEATFKRLSPEQQINKLLAAREVIIKRLAVVENDKIRTGYAQKQLEVEQKIASIRERQFIDSRRPATPLPPFLGKLQNAASLIPGFSRAAGLFQMFGPAALAGGAAVGAGKLLNGAAQDANNLVDLQSTTGFSLGGLQKLKFGAGATGVNEDAILGSAVTLRRNISKALEGDKGMIANLDRLGYSLEKLRQLAPEEVFFELGQNIKDGNVNALNFNATMEVLGGKTGENAKEVIKAFSNNMAELAKNFEKNGGIVGESTIQSLAEFRGEMQKTEAQAKSLAHSFLSHGAAGLVELGKVGFAGARRLFGGGSADDFAESVAQSNLVGDTGFDESLATTKRLQAKLADRQAFAQDEADFNFALDQLLSGEPDEIKTGKKSRGRLRQSTPTLDEWARIGLGSTQTEQVNLMKNQLAELKNAVRELKVIREEAQD